MHWGGAGGEWHGWGRLCVSHVKGLSHVTTLLLLLLLLACSSFVSSLLAGVCVLRLPTLAPPTNKQQARADGARHCSAAQGQQQPFGLIFRGCNTCILLALELTQRPDIDSSRMLTFEVTHGNADLRSDARQSQDNAQSERRCNHRRPAICAGAVVECTFRLAEAFWAHWSEQKPICQAR